MTKTVLAILVAICLLIAGITVRYTTHDGDFFTDYILNSVFFISLLGVIIFGVWASVLS